MTGEGDKRKRVIYAGLALVIAVAAFLSVTDREDTPQDARFTHVVSTFINLSAAPDDRGMDFLSRGRIQQANRLERLRHVAPEVLIPYADALGLSVDALRLQIADPEQKGPFDHTGVVFSPPQSFVTGQAGRWTWAHVTETAEIRAQDGAQPAACGQDRRCKIWLLYWDDKAWYYAPVGAPALNAALSVAMPELQDALPPSTQVPGGND